MSNSFKAPTPAGSAFFGAARGFNRAVNGALSRAHGRVQKQEFVGLSVSELTVLHVILEFGGAGKTSLEIAEAGTFDKGAFNRALPSLKERDMIAVSEEERDGSQEKLVTLTPDGQRIAELFGRALDEEVHVLLSSEAYNNLRALKR